MSAKDAAWLESLRPWAATVVRRLGVPSADAEDAVQEAFVRVAMEWLPFTAPANVPVRTARRRWIGVFLVNSAKQVRLRGGRARAMEQPGPVIDAEEHAVSSHEEAVLARDILRRLERSTTAERWRAWLLHEIDGVAVEEIARQEGRPAPTIYNLVRLAREDFAAALAREAAALRGPGRARPFLKRRS